MLFEYVGAPRVMDVSERIIVKGDYMVKYTDIPLVKSNDDMIVVRLVNKAGAPLVLSGNDNMYFTIKQSTSCSLDALVQKSFGDGIVNNSDGSYSIRIDAADTDGLQEADYSYDVKCILGEGTVRKTVLLGKIILVGATTCLKDEED